MAEGCVRAASACSQTKFVYLDNNQVLLRHLSTDDGEGGEGARLGEAVVSLKDGGDSRSRARGHGLLVGRRCLVLHQLHFNDVEHDFLDRERGGGRWRCPPPLYFSCPLALVCSLLSPHPTTLKTYYHTHNNLAHYA